MLKFIVKTLGIAAGLLLSCSVHAVGMGNINVTSALGEPLKAEIELVSVGKADKGNLAARMASPEVFKGAGIDYPASLPKLKFQLATRANGDYYIKLSTAQPVNDPFVNMLVELSWSSGRLLREYTFLLDPPGFKAEEPKAPEVQPVLSKAEAPPLVTSAELAHEEMAHAPMPTDGSMPMMGIPLRHGLEEKAEAQNVATGEIKVKRGDTLSKIAIENKTADVSLERMLVALYRANSDAFAGKNMNRLKTGKILRLPQASDLDAVEHAEAVKEVRAQAADWNAYRQKLASASAAAPEQAPKQEVSGKISTSVADKTPPAKEGAQDVVKLSKGEAPGDKAATGGKHAQEEEAIAKAKALNESNERIAMLEKTNKDMQHLLELKKQAAEKAAVAQAPVPEAKPATTAVPVEPAASGVTPAPAPAAKPAKPKMAPVAAPSPPPMLDEILGEPLYLAGAAAVLLGLGGFAYLRARRGKGGKPAKTLMQEVVGAKDDNSDTGSHIAAPVSPSPDTGDFTVGVAAVAAATQGSNVDPLSEADLFLNFGRDVQAEEILVDALKRDPASQQIKLKLLSIYASRKDTKSFSGIARQVQDSGDAVAWAQAAEMGRKLEPNNPMYGGGAGESEVTAPSQKAVPVVPAEQSAGLDFDLGFTTAESAADSGVLDVTQNREASTDALALDFDLGTSSEPATMADTSSMLPTPMDESAAAVPGALDFDITGTSPNLAADTVVAETSLDELALDIAPVAKAAATQEKTADVSTEDALAFTLDFPVTPESEPAAAPAAESEPGMSGLGEISLDLEVPAPEASAADEVKDSRWHEVATKLDLARAYQEMGDSAGAREILEEVVRDGDERQRAAAAAMMQQMPV